VRTADSKAFLPSRGFRISNVLEGGSLWYGLFTSYPYPSYQDVTLGGITI